MLPYARLTLGPGFRPIRAALYYSQRLVVRPWIRRRVASAIGIAVNLRHRRTRPRASKAERQESDRINATLRTRGISSLPNLLSAVEIDEMIGWLAAQEVVGPDSNVGLSDLPAGAAGAAYPMIAVLNCPHVVRVINHPLVLDVAEHYLGCNPTISSVGLRWSLSRPGKPMDVQRFHRDPDDWRFLKLFIYLTEVDMESGPHVYVAGSHETAGDFRARPYDRTTLERRYGAGSVEAVTGPVGTSFIADTYGIHMGLCPRSERGLFYKLNIPSFRCFRCFTILCRLSLTAS